MGYYAVHTTSGVLEHSAKGSTWKNHKYVKKENGRYIYPGKNNNDRKIRNMMENMDKINDYLKTYYNIDENDPEYKEIKNKIKAIIEEADTKYGANGMSSEAMTKRNENINKNFEKEAKDAAAKKVSRLINEDAKKFEKYSSFKKKGGNGMPSTVSDNLAYKQTYKVLNYDPNLNKYESLSSDHKRRR